MGAAADAWWVTDQPAPRARTRAPVIAIASRFGLTLVCLSSFANIHDSVTQHRQGSKEDL
jgi:hypothetical protein